MGLDSLVEEVEGRKSGASFLHYAYGAVVVVLHYQGQSDVDSLAAEEESLEEAEEQRWGILCVCKAGEMIFGWMEPGENRIFHARAMGVVEGFVTVNKTVHQDLLVEKQEIGSGTGCRRCTGYRYSVFVLEDCDYRLRSDSSSDSGNDPRLWCFSFSSVRKTCETIRSKFLH